MAKSAPAQAPVDVPANALAPVGAAAPPGQAAQPSRLELEQAAWQIKESLKSSAANLEFSIDEQSERILIRIVDSQTQEVIRQIPSEELLSIARALDRVQGLLVPDNA